jgi:uncharacterized ferritin-like protein (DUF455 family)
MSDRLDPALFAEGPARDARFVVVERWAACRNLPPDHPQKDVEFLHRQMNEEVNSLEISARGLTDFKDADWELRLSMARQCADEARHVLAFRRLFEARGGRVGEYPVLNFQYRIVTRIGSLAGRLAVQNRSFEAEGLDAIRAGIDEARGRGDDAMAELYDGQLADEIGHVRYANEWVREATRRDPRNLLSIAAALTSAARAFQQVMGREGSNVTGYLVDRTTRLEAGFRPDEVEAAAEQVAALRVPKRAAAEGK